MIKIFPRDRWNHTIVDRVVYRVIYRYSEAQKPWNDCLVIEQGRLAYTGGYHIGSLEEEFCGRPVMDSQGKRGL